RASALRHGAGHHPGGVASCRPIAAAAAEGDTSHAPGDPADRGGVASGRPITVEAARSDTSDAPAGLVAKGGAQSTARASTGATRVASRVGAAAATSVSTAVATTITTTGIHGTAGATRPAVSSNAGGMRTEPRRDCAAIHP